MVRRALLGFMRAAAATRREGHRSPRSGREGQREVVRAPEGGVPVWVSRGSPRRAADFSRSPHGHPKILIGGVIRCAVTATGSNYLREPMLNFGCSFSQSRCCWLFSQQSCCEKHFARALVQSMRRASATQRYRGFVRARRDRHARRSMRSSPHDTAIHCGESSHTEYYL